MVTAVDLFAGAGGATRGLRDAGFDVIGAIENDSIAASTYAANHPATHLWTEDVRRVKAATMRERLGLARGELTLLKACPPCQGFSTLADPTRVDEARNDLVLDTVRFVRALMPRAVLLENVPGLARDHRSGELRSALDDLGYVSQQYLVNATDFGVPQRRRRLIVIALRGRRLARALPAQLSSGDAAPVTVRTAFKELAAGQLDHDALAVARKLKAASKARVAAVPIGGTRFDLPPEHRLACHDRLDAKGTRVATGSYGRLRLDEPSPTMTTRCTTPACGSFVHPTLDRGLTLREAATLQTFPVNYAFTGGYDQVERQIGNAVPVRMAEALGRVVLACLTGTSTTVTAERDALQRASSAGTATDEDLDLGTQPSAEVQTEDNAKTSADRANVVPNNC